MNLKKFLMIALLTLCIVANSILFVGCAHKHEFDTQIKTNATHHWYECSCGKKQNETPHTYDNDCDTDCNACANTRTITHDYSLTLTAGETTHYYACLGCGDKKDETTHLYDQQLAIQDRLVRQDKASSKYYNSCVCGAKGSETFVEYNHTTTQTAWLIDCQQAETHTVYMEVGQVICFKVMGLDSCMLECVFKTAEGSSTTFTYESYQVDNMDAGVDDASTDAISELWRDIDGTTDLYVYITCVTAGELTITVA